MINNYIISIPSRGGQSIWRPTASLDLTRISQLRIYPGIKVIPGKGAVCPAMVRNGSVTSKFPLLRFIKITTRIASFMEPG